MPDAFIGVDVIVGARGETEELFEESFRFIESMDVSRLHVFPYSERPGTKALNIDYVVEKKDKEARVARMMELSEKKLSAFSSRFFGTERKVLLEHARHGDVMHGFTDNYLRVELPADDRLSNRMLVVRLDGFGHDVETIKGSIVSEL